MTMPLVSAGGALLAWAADVLLARGEPVDALGWSDLLVSGVAGTLWLVAGARRRSREDIDEHDLAHDLAGATSRPAAGELEVAPLLAPVTVPVR